MSFIKEVSGVVEAVGRIWALVSVSLFPIIDFPARAAGRMALRLISEGGRVKGWQSGRMIGWQKSLVAGWQDGRMTGR